MDAILMEKALRIMLEAHEGQRDLDGRAAVLHPLTVGCNGTTDEAKAAGWLHDVVEDCEGWTIERLTQEGMPAAVTDALRLLTHDKEEPYLDYVRRIIDSGNATAQEVKMNDLRHNLARGTAGGHEQLVRKHGEARNLFVEAGLWKNATL